MLTFYNPVNVTSHWITDYGNDDYIQQIPVSTNNPSLQTIQNISISNSLPILTSDKICVSK